LLGKPNHRDLTAGVKGNFSNKNFANQLDVSKDFYDSKFEIF